MLAANGQWKTKSAYNGLNNDGKKRGNLTKWRQLIKCESKLQNSLNVNQTHTHIVTDDSVWNGKNSNRVISTKIHLVFLSSVSFNQQMQKITARNSILEQVLIKKQKKNLNSSAKGGETKIPEHNHHVAMRMTMEKKAHNQLLLRYRTE